MYLDRPPLGARGDEFNDVPDQVPDAGRRGFRPRRTGEVEQRRTDRSKRVVSS